MNFQHDLLERPYPLPRVEKDGRRFYETPTGLQVPSVTTLLKEFYQKDGIAEWRERVGETVADGITHQASVRGQRLHNLCEKFLMNEDNIFKGVVSLTIADFMPVQEILLKHVTEVYGIELPLWSERLMTAGTADLVCLWDGVPVVLDFKTARKNKKEEWIEDYFVQASIYGTMVRETYGLDIRHIVILMAPQHEKPFTFVKSISDYEERLNEVCITKRPIFDAKPSVR
jgi:ATP-dependent exoDNAse (exonuclease V) beta subunit